VIDIVLLEELDGLEPSLLVRWSHIARPVATPGDFLIVAASTLIICTLATIYPALAAGKLRPVDGLRYE